MLTDRDLAALRSYDGDRSEMPNTGPKREPGYPVSRGSHACATCGAMVQTVFSLAGVGIFCSPACREHWVRR